MNEDELILHVTDQHGHRYTLPALPGWQVMEIIRDHDIPIRAECGGSCACATCHVYVARNWIAKLTSPYEDERYMLDAVEGYDPDTSRLSCQIILDETLNGLEVTLAPGSEP